MFLLNSMYIEITEKMVECNKDIGLSLISSTANSTEFGM